MDDEPHALYSCYEVLLFEVRAKTNIYFSLEIRHFKR